MTGGGYQAFISYSHSDAPFARWLHRRLETYRFPRRLVGRQASRGLIPARLSPIFRDREEFPAAASLSAEVRHALRASEALIVVCSLAAASSPWVDREISEFRSLHPGRPIFLALVAGEPGEAFPPAIAAEGEEPLAADLRKQGDGRRLGLLKLLAGLVGLPLGELVQRDAQRRLRRVTAVTALTLIAMVALAVLTVTAMRARQEAERQRAAAEGLIEFMLTDLRERLKGVGRLDVLTAANQRALEHYVGQNLEDLPADTLARRARVLLAMGEDDQARGDLAYAEAKFAEARRTTAALLANAPRDPEIIFAHAQSEFWVGSLAWQRDDLATAGAAFERYAQLAARLAQVAPDDVRSLKEVGYAAGNLCSLRYEQDQKQNLVELCAQALRSMKAAAERLPHDQATLRDVANRHAWLADAYRKVGNLEAARARRREEAVIIDRLLASDPQNARFRRARIWSERALSQLERESGQTAAAKLRLRSAVRDLEALVASDPENRELSDEIGKMKEELLK
jgi:MTH538 TIR-like domain (DUF1863)